MDNEAVAHLLFRERGKLHAYIWSFLHDAETEDVFQDVCLLAVRESRQIESEAHALSWFRRVARQRAIDCLRRRRRTPLMLDAAVLDALEPYWAKEDETPMASLVTALERCIERLTARARQIVKLRYVDGFSVGKVAETMGAQVDAMYKSLWRIHRTLGDCVQQQSVRDEQGGGK